MMYTIKNPDMMYTIKNKITGEIKQFKSFYDFKDWYSHLTIMETMNWTDWDLSEKEISYGRCN